MTTYLVEGRDISRFRDLDELVASIEVADVLTTDYVVIDAAGMRYELYTEVIHKFPLRRRVCAKPTGIDRELLLHIEELLAAGSS